MQTKASSDSGKERQRFVGTIVAKKYGPKQAQLLLRHKQIATTRDNYVLEEAEMGITNHLFSLIIPLLIKFPFHIIFLTGIPEQPPLYGESERYDYRQ